MLLSGCQKERTGKEGLFQYTVSGRRAIITGYTGGGSMLQIPAFFEDLILVDSVADGVIPQSVMGLQVPDGVEINWASLSDSNLRYVMTYEQQQIDGLPENCACFYYGQPFGEFSLQEIYVDSQGVLYGGMNDGESALLLSIPEDVEEYRVQQVILTAQSMYTVTSIDAAALDHAGSLRSLSLRDGMIFAPQLLDSLLSLEEFSYPDGSIAADYTLTLTAVQQINQQRTAQGMEPIQWDLSLIQAARSQRKKLDEQGASSASGDLSALKENKISYNLAASCLERGSDLEQLCSTLPQTLAAQLSDPLSAVTYERIGISAGGQGENCLAQIFLTNQTQTEVSDGSLRYQLQDGLLIPVAVEEGTDFLNLVPQAYGRDTTPLDQALLEQLPDTLRVAFISASYGEAIDPELFPEECVVVREGEETGDGLAQSLYQDPENGCLYVKTDRERYVLWDIPPQLEQVLIPETIEGIPVTYVSTKAVTGERALQELILPQGCGFDPREVETFVGNFQLNVHRQGEILLEPDKEFYRSMYCNAAMTTLMVELVNRLQPEEAEEIIPSYSLMRAAQTLAEEQSILFNVTRPDGSEWFTVLEEEDVLDWKHGGIWHKRLKSLDELTQLQEVAEDFAAFQEKSYFYHYVGVGMFVSDSGEFYISSIATEADDTSL